MTPPLQCSLVQAQASTAVSAAWLCNCHIGRGFRARVGFHAALLCHCHVERGFKVGAGDDAALLCHCHIGRGFRARVGVHAALLCHCHIGRGFRVGAGDDAAWLRPCQAGVPHFVPHEGRRGQSKQMSCTFVAGTAVCGTTTTLAAPGPPAAKPAIQVC